VKNFEKSNILNKRENFMKKKLCFFIFIVSSLYTYTKDVPISEIESELTQAEKDFQIAKKMFNPWYGGPLLTGSGNVMPPGYVNLNPQIQFTDYYAQYDGSRHSQPVDDKIEVNPTFSFGLGLINRLDMNINIGWDRLEQNDVSYGGWQDTSLGVSLAILKEAPYIPALKITLTQYFPTGKYENLNPDKINVQAIGSGSYTTRLGVNVSKVVWWSLLHPMQFRMSLNYGISPKVNVKNFHAYGGGYGTDGKIDPGNYFKANAAFEISMSQKIVFAMDFVYEYDEKITFKGINGSNADGTVAINESPSADQISLAPALEYNFTPDIALIGGLWFTLSGRNSSDFIAGIINFSYGF
jgi:hypothetical protein